MDLRYCSAQRAPALFVRRQCDRFLVVEPQVRTEDGADARRLGGLLELDGAVDTVGVGAGEGAEAARDGGLDQRRGTGGAEAEGEMAVDM